MIEGQIIMQNATATLGELEERADNGDPVYAMTFTDASGLVVTVLWAPPAIREFAQKVADNVGAVVVPPRPKLVLPGGSAN